MSSVRWRLGAMMFLEYAIWGAWAPFLWPFLTAKAPEGLAMSDPQAAFIFGLLWLACILAPFTGGQIADRWVPTQWFLAAVHFVGGLVLVVAAYAHHFVVMTVLMAIYSLLYAPTLALTNSLAFHHLKSEKDFGGIRVWGTLGWIVAGILLTLWRKAGVPVGVSDCLMLSAVMSLAMGVFCLFLPHTPPAGKEAADPLAFREAFVLLKQPNFLIFMLIAFVVTTELQFYYGPTGTFLESALKIAHANVPLTMAVAQVGEVFTMWLLLPVALRKIGLRKTLALGVIAWPLRYVVFAIAPLGALSIMRPLVILSLAIHGFGYAFFFVASQIFVDMVSPKDIRASAQSLLTLMTLGIGNYLGTLFTVAILAHFNPAKNPHTWTYVFLVPCALTVVCAIAFLLFFKDPEKHPASAAVGVA